MSHASHHIKVSLHHIRVSPLNNKVLSPPFTYRLLPSNLHCSGSIMAGGRKQSRSRHKQDFHPLLSPSLDQHHHFHGASTKPTNNAVSPGSSTCTIETKDVVWFTGAGHCAAMPTQLCQACTLPLAIPLPDASITGSGGQDWNLVGQNKKHFWKLALLVLCPPSLLFSL